MATIRSKAFKIAGSIIVLGLVALLLPTVVLHLFPFLPPISSQLLIRLREVVAFLAFTTVITIAIFSSQRKDVHSEKQNKGFLQHHPLGSIFGESDYEDMDPFYADNGKHALSPSLRTNDLRNNGLHDGDGNELTVSGALPAVSPGSSPHNMLPTEAAMEVSHMDGSLFTREENAITVQQSIQRRLHRKSSSLDDSVNYEPELKVAEASDAGRAFAATKEQAVSKRSKPVKRVSFCMASSPSSPKSIACDESTRQANDDPLEKQKDLAGTSPGDLTGQADAFIARFKEQLRLQRLESLQKYRRRS